MRRFLKWLIIGLLAVFTISIALLWTPDTDKDAMIAKYGGENSQFVRAADGLNIHYRDQGNPEGPVFVLLHGNSASLHTWELMIAELKTDYRFISLDLPGHGLTGPNASRDYSATSMHRAVLTVMDKAGVETAMIAGNSMGGWLSWRLALAYPERVEGLVLIDASGAITDDPVNLYLAAKISRSKFGQMITPKITPKSIIRKTLTQVIYDDDQVTEDLITRYRDLARFPGNRIAMMDRMKVKREPEYFGRIGEIDVPVLILWGEHDVTIPVSHAQAFKVKLPDSRVVIYPDAAHLPMEERPVKVARDIREWYEAMFSP